MKRKLLTLALCALSTASLASCGGSKLSSKSSYTVGVCQLVQHVALDAATQGFQDTLKAKVEAAGKTITFDVQNASGDSATCVTIASKFVAGNYDLIMANATPALQACANATLKIPVLGTSVTDYATALKISNWSGTVGGNISGTSDCAPLDKQADMFAELLPNAKKIGLLYCSAEANSKYQAEEVKKFLEAKNAGYEVATYTFSDSNDLAAVATQAAEKSDAIYVPTDNTVASNAEIVYNAAVKEKKVPIIAGEEGIAKTCGIATLSISYYDLGVKTGEMAAKILLEDADVSKMAVEYAANPIYEYNKALCQELGITVPASYTAIATE